MGRCLAFLLAMTIGLVAWIAAVQNGARAAADRYEGLRQDHASYAHPTDEQVHIRRWYRRHLAMLAQPLPVAEPEPIHEPVRPADQDRLSAERIVEHAPGELPADAMDSGKCAVRILLVDAESRQPVRAGVTLWRLFADGDETYRPGDEVRWSGISDDGEIGVSGLPDGTYRIESSWQRRGADDPQAFYISADTQDVTVPLQMPRTFDVHVRAFELDGTEVSEMDVRRGGHGFRNARDSYRAPRWADPREPVSATRRCSYGRTIGCGGGDDTARHVTATETGVFLAQRMEPSRTWDWDDRWRVMCPGALEIVCRLRSEDFTGDVTFAAPLVTADLVTPAIRLPDGEALSTSSRSFTATCLAFPATSADAHEAWRRAEVEVRVPREGGSGFLVYRWQLGGPGEDPVVERLDDSRW